MKIRFFLVFWVFLNLLSCVKSNDTSIDTVSLLQQWTNKEILFPADIVFSHYLEDTLYFDFQQSDYKILFYIDSIGCLECKSKLHRWKSLIANFDTILPVNIPYLFIFDVKNKNSVKKILYDNNFDYPICLDIDSKFEKLNQIPHDNRLQVFLLNKRNRIIAIGNPVQNESIKNFYMKQILNYIQIIN